MNIFKKLKLLWWQTEAKLRYKVVELRPGEYVCCENVELYDPDPSNIFADHWREWRPITMAILNNDPPGGNPNSPDIFKGRYLKMPKAFWGADYAREGNLEYELKSAGISPRKFICDERRPWKSAERLDWEDIYKFANGGSTVTKDPDGKIHYPYDNIYYFLPAIHKSKEKAIAFVKRLRDEYVMRHCPDINTWFDDFCRRRSKTRVY